MPMAGCCCDGDGLLPHLLLCDALEPSGMGLRPEDTPAGAGVGSVVEYRGLCYTVAAAEAELVPTTEAAILRGGCGVSPCGQCIPCDPGTSPTRLTVTLANIVMCNDCVSDLSTGGSVRVDGNINGTYDLPITANCQWSAQIGPLTWHEWSYINCTTEDPPGPPGSYITESLGVTLKVTRYAGAFGDHSFQVTAIRNANTVGLSGWMDELFGGDSYLGDEQDCRFWGGAVANTATANCAANAGKSLGSNGGGTATITAG
jgi:hypothetical protein